MVASGFSARHKRNRSEFVQITSEEAFWPRQGVHGEKLIELIDITQEEFSRRFKSSPVKRAKRRGLLRNVAVALGHGGRPEAVPALVKALHDDEPVVRGHAAWALGAISTSTDCPPEVASEIAGALVLRLASEEDGWVREEISSALGS